NEVELPGVGVRHEFITEDGNRVGVVSHRSGRREIYLADAEDPDRFRRALRLSEEDARTLAEILGASRVAAELAALQQTIEGLAIDWLPVREDSPYAHRPIGAARVRTRTGVSVVAVLRGDQAIAAPGSEVEMEPGDYLVVVGTPRGIEQVVEVLRSG
ncbi:MAG TPA: cation:proton antiporter regulatory subunit, partial [Actinomycetota bacterium]|nr:cation:proton antiporter regulatory subunit [Actinomycetota bacterium]